MINQTPPVAIKPPQTCEYWYRICLTGMFSSMPTYNAVQVVDHCIKNLDHSLPALPLPERLRLATIHHIRTIAFRGIEERRINGCPYQEWLECILRAHNHQGKWKEWGASTMDWNMQFTEGGVYYMNIAMGKMGMGGVSELVGGVWVLVEADYWEKNMQPQPPLQEAVQEPGMAERIERLTL